MKFLLICFTALAFLSGCSNPAAPVDNTPPHQTPFVFHKPRLGATFTMMAENNPPSTGLDTTFVFTVTDTALTIGGKAALKVNGYFRNDSFYISYRDNGDIDIAGSTDYIFGRDSWTWYPLSVDPGHGFEAYYHDSLISNPDPKDTRAVKRDTLIVFGKETLMIKGQPIECIKLSRRMYYELTSVKFGFKTGSSLQVDYWYAPSIGYWAKEYIKYGGRETTFTMIDYTL